MFKILGLRFYTETKHEFQYAFKRSPEKRRQRKCVELKPLKPGLHSLTNASVKPLSFCWSHKFPQCWKRRSVMLINPGVFVRYKFEPRKTD